MRRRLAIRRLVTLRPVTRRLAAAAALLLAAGMLPAQGPAVAAPPPATPATPHATPAMTAQTPPFNAATYNLRLNTPDDGPNAWPQRAAAVKALIQYHGFDLMGTQEGLIEQLRELDTMPGWARVGVGRDDGREGGEHAAIYFRSARFELREHGDFWLSATPERPSRSWDSRCCHRIATWARLRDREAGPEFFVFNVHFDHEGVVARRESARLLVRQVARIAGSAPVIVMGDFNSRPDTEQIGTMTAALRDAVTLAETPVYGPVGTFNAFRFDAPALDRIDYLFLSPGWRVLRLGVLTDSMNGRYPSDHFPVVARLAWTPAALEKRP